MRIGVVGASMVGTALAKRLVPKGPMRMLSYSRDVAKLARTAEALGATSGTPEQASAFAEVVALAVPRSAVPKSRAAARPLAGKVLWDCTSALLPDLSGMAVGTTSSGGGRAPGPLPVRAWWRASGPPPSKACCCWCSLRTCRAWGRGLRLA